MYGRFVGWFGAQPDAVKIMVLLAALLGLPVILGIAVLLSPLVAAVALLALLVGVLACVLSLRAGKWCGKLSASA